MRIPRLHYEVVEHRLSNGLQLRLLSDRTRPIVSLHLFFKVGSRDNVPGRTGLAHLFEHLYFNGSAKYGPGQFDRILEGVGGHSNAYTSRDLTVYHADFPSRALAQVLDLEADRMRSLLLDAEEFERERRVVMEERRLSLEEASGVVDEELYAAAFTQHPYGAPILGWMEDLERMTLDDVRAFHRTYYAPSNGVLWLVGDLAIDETLKAVERAFSDIPAGPPLPSVRIVEPPQRGVRWIDVSHPSETPYLAVGYHSPDARSEQLPALDLLQYVLGEGEGSVLRRALVHQRAIAIGLGVNFEWKLEPELFVITLGVDPRRSAAQAVKALDEELEKFASGTLPDGALERARGQLVARVASELETRSARAHELGQGEQFFGRWDAVLALPDRYASVTKRNLIQTAAALLDQSRRTVVRVTPGGR